MTTMQTMACMMRNSASATCADAATSCAYTMGMQSASFGMIMMGAMIMASIIILSAALHNLILVGLLTVVVLCVVLLGVVVKKKYFNWP